MRARLFLLVLALAPLLQGCFPLAAVGVGATALAVDDRRTGGIYIEDENIEWKARFLLLQNFKDTHVNVTSFNLTLLVTGEVADEKTKSDVAESLRKIPSVKNVVNELVIGGKSSLGSRSNDALITTNVKARFLGAKGFSSNHVKVVTEAGVVHLMGVVTKEEADAASDVARSTSGVLRVVKVFEVVDQITKR